MINMKITIDDSQIRHFAKKSPKRADWALKEAFSMCGGHYRKELRKNLEHGKIGGPKNLHPFTTRKRATKRSPLKMLGKMVRFKVGRSKGNLKLQFGFLGGGKRYFKQKLTTLQVAKIHEYGKRIRITAKMRKMFAAAGYPLKKNLRYLHIPARQMIVRLWQRRKTEIPQYIEKRFFQKFFSNQNSRLKI